MMGKLTTQTPAMAYLPSTAFRSMTLALFWERSYLGVGGASASAMVGLERRGKAQWQIVGWDECVNVDREVSIDQLDRDLWLFAFAIQYYNTLLASIRLVL